MKGNFKFLFFVIFFLCFEVLAAELISEEEKTELISKAELGELSEEEYEKFIKYGLCKPLKDNFLEDRERGWAYGEFCSKENLTRNYKKKKNQNKVVKFKKDVSKKERVIGITGTGGEIVAFDIDFSKVKEDKYLDSLDAKKFRYLIQVLMDEASYNPTPENVENYLYVQDYMARKALKVARVWQQVILTNPKLGGYGRFTKSSWEEKVNYKERIEDRKRFFKNLRNNPKEKVGIYIFVKGGCKYCHIEMDAIHKLIADYGLEVMTVSFDYCPNNFPNCIVRPKAFKVFNISVTPTIVLVVARNNKPKFQPIAVGLTSENVLVKRIIYYYKFLKTGKHIDDRTIIWGSK